MGLAFWGLILCGALVGHIVTIANLVVFLGLAEIPHNWVDPIIAKAVKAALKECAEWDWDFSGTTTTTTTTPEPNLISVISRDFCGTWVIRFQLILAILWIFVACLFWWRGRSRAGNPSELEDSSPVDKAVLPIETLARHQIAELRLRRAHGAHEQIRASGV